MITGQRISSEFKKAGMKAIRTTSTSIHGLRNATKGDYEITTGKSFGLYGLEKWQRVRTIQFQTTELKNMAKLILIDLGVDIIAEYENTLIMKS